MSPRQRNSPKERLRLTLEAPATPERVREIADMFADTVREICSDLAEGEVTMVVDNLKAVTEVRGWGGDGEVAVKLFGDLVDNSTEAVQAHAELAPAARTLAAHADKLTPYRPTFWRGRKKLRAVDEVFVRTMRAAGTEAIRAQIAATPGHVTGDTIVYSPVIRVGRQQVGSRVLARIRVEGKFCDVAVDDDLVDTLFEVAKSGATCQFRVCGRWDEDDTGELHLASPRVVEANLDYSPWSGREILEASHKLSHLFTAEDFERMMDDLQPEDMG